jgi:hypothetical protein
MREICTSGSVGGEGGNILAYPALSGRSEAEPVYPPLVGTAAPLGYAALAHPTSQKKSASRGSRLAEEVTCSRGESTGQT